MALWEAVQCLLSIVLVVAPPSLGPWSAAEGRDGRASASASGWKSGCVRTVFFVVSFSRQFCRPTDRRTSKARNRDRDSGYASLCTLRHYIVS